MTKTFDGYGLTEAQKKIAVLYYCRSMDTQEIAELVDISHTMVSRILNAIRKSVFQAYKNDITCEGIRDFLISKGWEHISEFPNTKVMVFSNTKNKTLVIPSKKDFLEFDLSVPNVIESICFFEKKDYEEALKEICQASKGTHV